MASAYTPSPFEARRKSGSHLRVRAKVYGTRLCQSIRIEIRYALAYHRRNELRLTSD